MSFVDWNLLAKATPIVLLLWTSVLFVWSRLDYPIRRTVIDATPDDAFDSLRTVVHSSGLFVKNEDAKALRIVTKAFFKFGVMLGTYRWWSREVVFQVETSDSGSSELVVVCWPNPVRITTSLRHPAYLSSTHLDELIGAVEKNAVRGHTE